MEQCCGKCKWGNPIEDGSSVMVFCEWKPAEELAKQLPASFMCDPMLWDDGTDCPCFERKEAGS